MVGEFSKYFIERLDTLNAYLTLIVCIHCTNKLTSHGFNVTQSNSFLFHWLLWYTKCLHYLSDYTVLTHLNTNEYTIFQDLADHDLTLCIHCANISNTIYTIDNSKKFFIATTPFTDDESILYLVLSWLLSLNINKLSLILCFYCANTSNQILYTMFKKLANYYKNLPFKITPFTVDERNYWFQYCLYCLSYLLYFKSTWFIPHRQNKNNKKTIITEKPKKKLKNLLKNIYVLYPLSHPL